MKKKDAPLSILNTTFPMAKGLGGRMQIFIVSTCNKPWIFKQLWPFLRTNSWGHGHEWIHAGTTTRTTYTHVVPLIRQIWSVLSNRFGSSLLISHPLEKIEKSHLLSWLPKSHRQRYFDNQLVIYKSNSVPPPLDVLSPIELQKAPLASFGCPVVLELSHDHFRDYTSLTTATFGSLLTQTTHSLHYLADLVFSLNPREGNGWPIAHPVTPEWSKTFPILLVHLPARLHSSSPKTLREVWILSLYECTLVRVKRR